jgi:LuxR family quorum sensing-dependent transcriptional regulator
MKKLLEKTTAFILSLDDARDTQALSDSILEFTKQFGAEYVLAGGIPSPGTPSLKQKDSVLLKAWPSEWEKRYLRRNYFFNDPTIKNLFLSQRPFFWSELDHLIRDDGKASLVMNEARDFGFKAGISVPLFTLENEMLGFALAGEHMDTCEDVRHAISIIANYAVGRAIALRESESVTEVRLTHREREVLQWISAGHLRHEVAERMKISEHGVDKHLRSCREKLGAKTTSFAVAQAMRRRIIS